MSKEPAEPVRQAWIPLCVPEIRGNEWRYVKECLDTNFVSSVGPFVERFERQLAEQIGSRFAVATVNGTAALHVALLLAGVEPDDEVLVSTLTFIAPVNTIRYVGAWPVFVDAEPTYWQMDPQKVIDWLEHSCRWGGGVLRNRATGRRVRAILPVHVLGHPVEMDPIVEIARTYNLAVVEDATESLGGKYREHAVGTIGDIGCFSFNGNKLITTGGGGMIVTDREDLAAKARYLSTQAKDDPLEFVHGQIGYNYRLSNVHAALGCAQLEHLAEYIEAKQSIARKYAAGLANLDGIRLMCEAPWATSVFWLYTILVDVERFGIDSRALMRYLDHHQVQTRPLWQPIHQSPAHQGMPGTDCSVAEWLNRSALSLPCSAGLTRDDQECVIDHIRRAGKGRRQA